MKLIFNVPKYDDGDLDAFINKPFVYDEQAIGVIESARAQKFHYELTVHVWDEFIEAVPNFLDDKFSSISFRFK
ncbi:hypothetical protein [Paenibacillus taichungensis]|uniref:hypothetical protein n=1 Tax=Paenibacillus taichungensis TaxID=484184 RepID=UPI0039A1592E